MPDRRFYDVALMYRLLPWIWAGGSSLFLGVVLLGGVDRDATIPYLAVDAAGWLVFAILAVGGRRLPDWLFGLAQYAGIAIVSTLVVLGDAPESPFALFYLWLAVQGAYFDRWHHALAQGLCAAGAYAAALAIVSGPSFAALQWLMLVATLFVVGTLVAMLRGSVNDLVARLNALAQTDELTGLGNRRHLLSALDEAISTSTPQARVTVALLDLDGFKNYNDSFGHPAGDALLARLAGRLQESLDGAGQAFRLGGDEFCVIVTGDAATRLDAVARAAAALTERGEGFAIGASTGIVEAPTEVSTSIAALALADQRLYGEKMLRQPARAQRLSQAADRSPHDRRTADYARHVAARLGLGGEELDIVVRAAELHDIGMIAIPQDLLRERGELSDDQREFLRSYVLIGERLLHATPPLREVAQIVRCAQERWDGSGYPDGLAGTAIPLAARIVAACSAFTAMTSERDYRSRLTDEEAIGELRSGAGSQFDPDVVEALVATLRDLVPLTDPTASTLTEH